jgi:hypothetical protein
MASSDQRTSTALLGSTEPQLFRMERDMVAFVNGVDRSLQ